jgi:hypothetical protein
MYMEWTQAQWAEACAWFESVYGWTPMPDHDGAGHVFNGWANRRTDAPGSRLIALVEFRGHERPAIAMNWPWARKLWWEAIKHSWRARETGAPRVLFH